MYPMWPAAVSLFVAAISAALPQASGAPVIVAPKTLLTTASPATLSYSGFSNQAASITLSSRTSPTTVVASASISSSAPDSGTVALGLPSNLPAGLYLLNATFATGYRQSGDVTIINPSNLMARSVGDGCHVTVWRQYAEHGVVAGHFR